MSSKDIVFISLQNTQDKMIEEQKGKDSNCLLDALHFSYWWTEQLQTIWPFKVKLCTVQFQLAQR
jgi:hypothetical protein